MTKVRSAIAVAFVSVAFVACKARDQAATSDSAAGTAAPATATADTTTAPRPADSSAASAPAPATSDANILAKADAGDSSEVAVASYVQANSSTAGVKAYAKLLQRDHGKGLSNVEALAKKLNITMQLPAGDTTAQSTSHVLDRLKSLKGHDLDTAFVNHEIDDHKSDIDDAKQMQSAAQSAEVKAMLQKELPELQKHLSAAEKLSTELSARKK